MANQGGNQISKNDYFTMLPSVTPHPKMVQWIPVNKQLPKESGKYLVTFGGTHHIGIDFYNTEEDAKKIFEEPEEKDIGWRSHNVVAWMPLPESYKPEREG